MGVGFIITVGLLSVVLGLFARQALSGMETPPEPESHQDAPHTHAM
ncbi:hypothetical protein [Alicyclobacillus macrosporangiidus]|jgi:hypothetical protein|uniref:Uncharacterized protein n=1 Tax=Alicyclobacillus macrosporangiidus TaxID=392015 RepID=A0A1I7FMF9_9BACL|nr:hypothetical protein [Alicyclobacillus macrosporangiidus]SFU37318.1 hypothetical protein SAMN05421543_101339 [Alicyclobacillus macrosporangiidus]